MLSKLIKFVKENQTDIILIIGVILISLFSFATGYIVAKKEMKTPIRFENESSDPKSSYYWRWHIRALSGLEIG